jgi:hypothetical protein
VKAFSIQLSAISEEKMGLGTGVGGKAVFRYEFVKYEHCHLYASFFSVDIGSLYLQCLTF